MSTSLRRLTPTSFSVYDAQENLVGRIYRDFSKNWYAQRRIDAAWTEPSLHRSRRQAVAALEVTA